MTSAGTTFLFYGCDHCEAELSSDSLSDELEFDEDELDEDELDMSAGASPRSKRNFLFCLAAFFLRDNALAEQACRKDGLAEGIRAALKVF